MSKKVEIIKKIESVYSLSDKEKRQIEYILDTGKIDEDKTSYILDKTIAFQLDKSMITALFNYQLFKVDSEKAEEFAKELSPEENKIIGHFKNIRDINSLTPSEEIEDIRRMFIVMGSDMRVVIMKLFGICYEMTKLNNPLNEQQQLFLRQVKEIHVPLSERLGLDKLKLELNDNVVRLEYPEEYKKLVDEIESHREENEKQLEISKNKMTELLKDLKIEGKIESRIKHISSIFNKLYVRQLALDQIYDILAIRIIVKNVEDCYSVLGKIHSIYKPMLGRVKDYIASPKPNGYQTLHTTIIVENQHPLEVQIRTEEMHRNSEYGLYAHWLYKENKDKKNAFDKRLTWFRESIDNAKNMNNNDFIETLKGDLYDGVIVVQTPKGRVIEFPKGSTVIDFAYAIHSGVGNSCVGAKINGKLKPITSQLRNGDIVEILTNPHSKGPSRDWLKFVKTSAARNKIKSFYKNELKDENIKLGKSMLNQMLQEREVSSSKINEEKYSSEILKRFNVDSIEEIYAGIGSGSITAGQVVSKLISLISKEKKEQKKIESVVHLQKNKDGILIDGDSGMLVRFSGCCNPIEGDDIIGYVSRGKGVTIHRANCHNLNFLEKERLIDAEWQIKEDTTFIANIKVIARKNGNNIGRLTNLISNLRVSFKGLDVKEVEDKLTCTIIIEVKNKAELDSVINSLRNMKDVIDVYRSEGWT